MSIGTNTVYLFFSHIEGGSTVSTSLLHHAFGIAGFHCTSIEYESGQIVFHIQPGNHPLRCPCCNSTNVIRRGQKQRRFRAAPIGNKPVFIVLALPRVGCRDCGAVRQIKVSFADPHRSFTRAFERYVLDLSRMTRRMMDGIGLPIIQTTKEQVEKLLKTTNKVSQFGIIPMNQNFTLQKAPMEASILPTLVMTV